MKKLSPLIKGLITAALMIIVASVLYYSGSSTNTGLQNLGYFIYAGGIIWTLFDYSRSEAYTGKFGDIFLQGFRCFVVVTLVMVIYMGIFSKMHPEMAKEYGKLYKEEMLKTEKNRNATEIDEIAKKAEEGYTTALVYSSVFGYLLVGSVFTLAGAGLLLIRKKQ
jgi:hypothetical protein